MQCNVRKIVKVSGIMSVIMGAISLHAWFCKDCQEEHKDPYCPQTYKDQDGNTPSDYPQAGNLPNGVFVFGTPHGPRVQNGQAVHEVGRDYFLYKLPTSFETPIYYDGINNAYNENGEEYPIIGFTADNNLVFLYKNDSTKSLLFVICLNECRTVIQSQGGCFLYETPRYQSVSDLKDVYYNGFEYVDLEGNTYEKNELKICRDTDG
jgi:hypothetical protein